MHIVISDEERNGAGSTGRGGYRDVVTKEKQSELITGTEDREYDINWLNHIPGIAGIRLQKPDDLWNIAKKFHTTVQDIKTVNELSEEKRTDGMKLLVVKK